MHVCNRQPELKSQRARRIKETQSIDNYQIEMHALVDAKKII